MTGSSSSWSRVSTRGWCICQTSPSYFGLPESITRWPKREPLAHEGLVEPEGAELPGAAADRDAQHAAAGAGRALVDVFDHAADALQLALLQLVDFPLSLRSW